MENYQIHLQSFEGPMDLLMHLIAKNKIDIYDIPIATLTEQYLAYLDEMKRFDIEIASSFLVMAATLLSIKSRMMLPKTVVTEDEEEEDPRKELVERILAYRKYQQASCELTARAEQEGRYCSHDETSSAPRTGRAFVAQKAPRSLWHGRTRRRRTRHP